jgi:hypothetical protein
MATAERSATVGSSNSEACNRATRSKRPTQNSTTGLQFQRRSADNVTTKISASHVRGYFTGKGRDLRVQYSRPHAEAQLAQMTPRRMNMGIAALGWRPIVQRVEGMPMPPCGAAVWQGWHQ